MERNSFVEVWWKGAPGKWCSVVKVFDNLGTNFRGSQKALHQGSSTQIWVSNLYTPCVCVWVCVWERERETDIQMDRHRDRESHTDTCLYTRFYWLWPTEPFSMGKRKQKHWDKMNTNNSISNNMGRVPPSETSLKCKKGMPVLNAMAAKGIAQCHLFLLHKCVVLTVTDNTLGLTTMAQTNLLKLDRVQNEAMRVILWTTKDTPNETMWFMLDP